MSEIDILREGYRQLGGAFDEWRDLVASKLVHRPPAPVAAPDMRGRGTQASDLAGARPRRARPRAGKRSEAERCERLPDLLAKIHRWLRPGGWFMHAFGTSDNPGWTGTWIDDAPVYFASYEPPMNTRLVRDAGFVIERDELVTLREPKVDGDGRFQWILARR